MIDQREGHYERQGEGPSEDESEALNTAWGDRVSNRGVFSPISGRPAPHPVPLPGWNISILWLSALIPLVATITLLGHVGRNSTGLPVDRDILDWIVASRSEPWTHIVPVFSMIGSTPVFTPIMIVFAGSIAYFKRSLWPVIMLALTATLSVSATVIIKNVFNRQRPPLETQLQPYEYSGSFPSGHTLNAFALVSVSISMVLRWAVRTWLRWATVILGVAYMFAMAFSRVYMGVHWLSDVQCGAMLGAAIGFIMISVDVWARSHWWSREINRASEERLPRREVKRTSRRRIRQTVHKINID